MIPFRVKFTLRDNNETFIFESNEKPFKGDVYSIEENGSHTSYKITDVIKTIVRENGLAHLEYQCAVEKNDVNEFTIGFK
jgi:hypothetical protein